MKKTVNAALFPDIMPRGYRKFQTENFKKIGNKWAPQNLARRGAADMWPRSPLNDPMITWKASYLRWQAERNKQNS